MSILLARAGRRRRGLAFLAFACLVAWAIVVPGRALAAYGDEYGLAAAQGAIPGAAAFWAGSCDLASGVTEYEEPGPGHAPPASPRDCIDTGTVNPEPSSPLAFSPVPAWRLGAVTQAGAHPDATTLFAFSRDITDQSGQAEANPFAAGSTRDVKVKLPVGTVGDPGAVAKCSGAQFNAVPPECPPQSQVGVTQIFAFALGFAVNQVVPVYDLAPLPGRTAEFGIPIVAGATSIRIDADARTDSDFGITAGVERIPTGASLLRQTLTLWGVPWAASHDPFRPRLGFLQGGFAGGVYIPPSGLEPADQASYEPSWGPIEPFFTNPTSCDGEEQLTSFFADSWQNPAATLPDGEPDPSDPAWVTAGASAPPLSGCEGLSSHFDPGFTFQPQSHEADSPSAYDVDLSVPQNDQPPAGVAEDPSESGAPAYWKSEAGLATSQLKDTTVTLPAGVVVNPSAANGLEACSEEQIGLTTTEGAAPNPIRFDNDKPTCPDASKIGTVEIETPLLEETLDGTVYIAQQEANPFHSLLALYLVVEDPERGLIVKLAGETTPDPVSGQLTASFTDNPQLPFTHLRLHLKGGAAAPLATPPTCGTFTTTTSLTPWSGQAAATPGDTFAISAGAAGGACATSGAGLPFAPSFEAGTTSTQAGAYAPLVIKLSRQDGEQEPTHLNFTLPEGAVAQLAGVARCSDSAIAATAGKTGRQEQASPSCPEASEIGTVDAAAGVGPEPFHVAGKVYLAGAYEGAPLSAVVITPAVAGPFDLGDVVVRAPVFIDPATAQVTVKSDAIPTILRGIPLKLRSVAITLARPGFSFNPTSCDAMSVTATATGSSGASSPLSSRFQVGGCSSLAFKPAFTTSTSAKTSKADGASLSVKLVPPAEGPQNAGHEEANLAYAKVELPKALPSRLTTLQKACTAAQFNVNPAGCPAASVVGHAVAHTPVLSVPLEGPAYFVSHGNEAFPQLIVVLQGEGITVDLAGSTFISKTGVTSSTFKTVPDVPVSSFELTLPQGPYSALAANTNLCAKPLLVPTEFIAQNGAQLRQSTAIAVAGCPTSLSFTHKINKKTLTLSIYAPAAGKVKIAGKGLHSKTKTAKGRETLTINVNQKKAGKLKTKVRVTYTPSTGKDRKKQVKTAKLRFKR